MTAARIGLAAAATGTAIAMVAGAWPTAASTAHLQPAATACAIAHGTADAACTPGALNPSVTQETIHSTICVTGWTATIRPPASYTTALKNRQKIPYGEADIPNSELEEDHLIPLELGGAPRDPDNLWPEPRTSAGTTDSGEAAEDKDREETALKVQVCRGDITLDEAQQQILADWTH
ncbi:hypothetical protein HC031_27625 [Planosporangium thailandense]|uniref:HNH endonuclease n=1 Tax=Planosporangium thailandense TaxID=765197 RepID=A0ABX0Y5T5_9ACTN|nr:hypothetical protein [Planosporangium thailandense]NJC73466.1 hypothetical protein [Planosporangium thailandense]